MAIITGINGSHRRESNTSYIIEKALEVCEKRGHKVEHIDLYDKKIGYCTVCDRCRDEYKCSIDDDVSDILDSMRGSDAIIVGSPTYFADMTSRLKALFDRSIPLRRNEMMLAGKIGAAMATGGSRNGGQEHAISQIHNWMLLNQMCIVADKKTAHFGGICKSQAPGTVNLDDIGLATVKNTAENLCDMLDRLG